MNNEYIAHVRKNDDGTWEHPHLLLTHLIDTSKLSKFDANVLAAWLKRWKDEEKNY